eukprot:244347_1
MQFRISPVKCPTCSAVSYAVMTRNRKVHLVKRSTGERWSISLGVILQNDEVVPKTPGKQAICNQEEMKSNDLNSDQAAYASEQTGHKAQKEDSYSQALHIAKLVKEIETLKARNDMLTRAVSKSHENSKAMNSKLLDDKKEFETKYLRIQKALCYNMWTVDDVYQWLIHIDNARYKKYANELLTNLKDEGINGNCLEVMNEMDLHRIGIKDFRDKKWLIQQIDGLIKNSKRKEDELAVCTICYKDTMSFAVEPCHHLYCKQCTVSFEL